MVLQGGPDPVGCAGGSGCRNRIPFTPLEEPATGSRSLAHACLSQGEDKGTEYHERGVSFGGNANLGSNPALPQQGVKGCMC